MRNHSLGRAFSMKIGEKDANLFRSHQTRYAFLYIIVNQASLQQRWKKAESKSKCVLISRISVAFCVSIENNEFDLNSVFFFWLFLIVMSFFSVCSVHIFFLSFFVFRFNRFLLHIRLLSSYRERNMSSLKAPHIIWAAQNKPFIFESHLWIGS